MLRPTKRQRLERPPSWLDCASLQAVPAAATATTTRPRTATTGETSDNADNDDGMMMMIRTPLASSTTKDIFLDRLRKEVVDRYRFSAKSPRASGGSGSTKHSSEGETNDLGRAQQRVRALLRRRIAVGLNECTRVLESAAGRRRRESAAAMNCDRQEVHTKMEEKTMATCDGTDPGDWPLLVVVAAEGMRPSPLPVVHVPVLARELDVPLLLLPDSSTRRALGRILGIKSASVLAFLSRPMPPPPPPQSPHSLQQHKDGGQVAASSSCYQADCEAAGPTPDEPEDIRAANAGLDSFISFVCGKVEPAAPASAVLVGRSD